MSGRRMSGVLPDIFELRFSLGKEGEDGKNLNSQTWPGTPRRPSPRHPRPSYFRGVPSDGLRRYGLSILKTEGKSEIQMPLKQGSKCICHEIALSVTRQTCSWNWPVLEYPNERSSPPISDNLLGKVVFRPRNPRTTPTKLTINIASAKLGVVRILRFS